MPEIHSIKHKKTGMVYGIADDAVREQLTEKEVRFCMLVRLGLTNHELTNVYSISEASMKQRLFDYKARLGLTDPAVSLRRFLTTF